MTTEDCLLVVKILLKILFFYFLREFRNDFLELLRRRFGKYFAVCLFILVSFVGQCKSDNNSSSNNNNNLYFRNKESAQ